MIKDPKAYASELLDWYGGGRLSAIHAFMEELLVEERIDEPRLPLSWSLAVIHELTREEGANQ